MKKMFSTSENEDDAGDGKPEEPSDEEPKKKKDKKDKKKDPGTPRPKVAMKKANATPKSGVKATWPRKPCIGWEYTRKQVMCRSGKGGSGSTLAMKFADYGGKHKAFV